MKVYARGGAEVGIEIVERIIDRNQRMQTSNSELLIRFLLAVREVQSMGITLSSRRAEDSGTWCHWAHVWLQGSSSDESLITDILPSQLLSTVPADLTSVRYARDWLGFFAGCGMTLSAPDESRKLVVPAELSIADAVGLLRSGKLRDRDRSTVYEKILGTDELCSHETNLNPCLISRFAKIVFLERACPLVATGLATRFLNRVVLHDFSDTFFKLLRLVDKPLAECLTFEQIEPLWQSVLACTLREEHLKILWDLCLVSPPEFLVRVVVFSVVELRDLVMQEHGSDAVLTMGELVHDFNVIIDLAVANEFLA